MEAVNLNLARKWRSKNFEQIVGQDLSVRMLKNSLFLDQYFPVYLFSGQRGCGKTSSARVFAAAVNCEKKDDFRKDPKSFNIPCLLCKSCIAMQEGKHPDFIEIDAASYTGVDNVRQIIETSSMLPLMGRKKIYLIDEVHMLSKAAFNAFLKILEEPPASVLFILATTDPEKIIDTVKSRCFRLFFNAVKKDQLFNHLIKICKEENITYEDSALELIIKETDGSVRDAINLLEQVRFGSEGVTKDLVLKVMGYVPEKHLIRIFELLIKKDIADLLAFFKEIELEEYSADLLWKRMLEVARGLIWLKHDVEPDFGEYCEDLKIISSSCSLNQLGDILEVFYKNELAFIRTTFKHSFLEMLLLKIAGIEATPVVVQKKLLAPSVVPGVKKSFKEPVLKEVVAYNLKQEVAQEVSDEDVIEENYDAVELVQTRQQDTPVQDEKLEKNIRKEVLPDPEQIVLTDGVKESGWIAFLNSLESIEEPLVMSVFRQGKFVDFGKETFVLKAAFPKRFELFKDKLNETSKKWMPLLRLVFSDKVRCAFVFENDLEPVKKKSIVGAGEEIKRETSFSQNINTRPKSFGHAIDISDKEKWKLTNSLLDVFPGTITEVKEDLNG
ncbi:MAG: polymerase III, subunit gamma and tau protein [candidate division TM6 bacterium GW2011_GWF2_32_72]|nr:MAG: polymerase III, subunit gamma and tau protein [candidate division TM6 bacterium GW2011_GWF2_32_72]